CPIDAGDRTVAEKFGLKKRERRVGSLDLGPWPPEEPPTHDLRMQSAHVHGDPPQRNAASDEPLGQLSQYLLRLRRRPCAVNQPIHSRFDSGKGRVSRAPHELSAARNCTRDEGGPFEFGDQEPISSHRKLLRTKAVVVSV